MRTPVEVRPNFPSLITALPGPKAQPSLIVMKQFCRHPIRGATLWWSPEGKVP